MGSSVFSTIGCLLAAKEILISILFLMRVSYFSFFQRNVPFRATGFATVPTGPGSAGTSWWWKNAPFALAGRLCNVCTLRAGINQHHRTLINLYLPNASTRWWLTAVGCSASGMNGRLYAGFVCRVGCRRGSEKDFKY